jgi:hypothetical protein
VTDDDLDDDAQLVLAILSIPTEPWFIINALMLGAVLAGCAFFAVHTQSKLLLVIVCAIGKQSDRQTDKPLYHLD